MTSVFDPGDVFCSFSSSTITWASHQAMPTAFFSLSNMKLSSAAHSSLPAMQDHDSFSRRLEYTAFRLLNALEVNVSTHQRASDPKGPYGGAGNEQVLLCVAVGLQDGGAGGAADWVGQLRHDVHVDHFDVSHGLGRKVRHERLGTWFCQIAADTVNPNA